MVLCLSVTFGFLSLFLVPTIFQQSNSFTKFVTIKSLVFQQLAYFFVIVVKPIVRYFLLLLESMLRCILQKGLEFVPFVFALGELLVEELL